MTYTSTANNFYNNFYIADCFNQDYLIQMPSHFTARESSDFKQQFQDICQKSSDLKKIICDFSQTIFMDSRGLNALCQIFQLAQKEGIDLSFSSFSPQIKIILSLTGLDELF